MEKDFINRIPNWLRYVLAVPIGMVAVIITFIVINISILWIASPESLYYIIGTFVFRNFINIIAFFYAFNYTLPKHQFKITLTLSIIIGIFYSILIGISLAYSTLSLEYIIADLLVITALISSCVIAYKEYKM